MSNMNPIETKYDFVPAYTSAGMVLVPEKCPALDAVARTQAKTGIIGHVTPDGTRVNVKGIKIPFDLWRGINWQCTKCGKCH